MKVVFRDACKRIVHIVILLAFPVVFIHQFSTAQLVGTTWTSRASSSDDTWEGVAYGNGLFAAVAKASRPVSAVKTLKPAPSSRSFNISWVSG